MQSHPGNPSREAVELGLAHLHNRVEAGDDGHGALVEVLECLALVGGGLLVDLCLDELGHVCATLDRNLCHARQAVQGDHVADHVDVGVLAHGQIIINGDTASAVCFDACLVSNHLAQWGSGHTSGPNLGCALNGDDFVVFHVLVSDGVLGDVGDHGVQTHIDAETFQGALRLAAQALAEWRKNLRCAIKQVDLGAGGAVVGVLVTQSAVSQLGDLAGQLNTSWAGADDDEGQETLALSWVVNELGLFEGGDDSGTQLQCVIQGLHTRSELSEVIVAEVGLPSASGDDEGIVGEGTLEALKLSGNGLAFQIDVGDFAVDEVSVGLVAQKLTGGRSNLAGGNHAGGYLVQHRLEKVMVLLINQGDLNVSVLQLLNCIEAAEAGADDDYMVASACRAVRGFSHSGEIPS